MKILFHVKHFRQKNLVLSEKSFNFAAKLKTYGSKRNS